MAQDDHSLEGVLDTLRSLAEEEADVTLGDIRDQFGGRSLGPFLLILGIIATSPIGAIPGVPSAIGIVIVLVTAQFLGPGDGFWLPQRLANVSVDDDKIRSTTDKLRVLARTLDRWFNARLTSMVAGPGRYGVYALCIVLGLAMIPLEVVPLAVMIPGLAICLMGIGLVTRDGVLICGALAGSLSGIVLGFTQLT